MQFNFGEMAMSRPLKFRAWDGKEMWTGFEFVPIDIIVPPAWKKTTNKNMIWQQYTGLHDKNGKEIFEGDIVIGRNYKNEAGNPREVKWSNSGYEAGGLPLWALNKSEVIGNIYEHPHLLEDK